MRAIAPISLAGLIFAFGCSGNDSPTAPRPPAKTSLPTASPSPAPTTPTKGHGRIYFATAAAGGMSISTDKDDYSPGDTVHFTGTGWTSNDTLNAVLSEATTGVRLTWAIPVAPDGTFRDSTYVVSAGDLGAAFTLTVTSKSDPTQTLTVLFTDANIKVQSNAAGVTFTLTAIKYTTSSNCSTGAQAAQTPTIDNNGSNFSANAPSVPNPGGESWKFTAAATSDQGAALKSPPWNLAGNDSTNNPICVAGASGAARTLIASYDAFVDLTITKTHSGTFTAGSSASYTITVTNGGSLPTSASVIVTDTVPTGFTSPSGSGTNWSCVTAGPVVTCTRGGGGPNVITAGASAPPITLTVNVAGNAPASITNVAWVGGGGEPAAKNGNNSASDPTTIVFPTAGTTTSLQSSANPSVFGQSVTFTATVKVTATNAAVTTGTVAIFEGTSCASIPASPIGSGTPSASGQVTGSISSLAVGPHSIIACYSGASGFAASNGTLTQTVNQAATSVALTDNPAGSSVFGQSVTFTATVTVQSPGSGTPNGSVTFKVGGTSCADATQLPGAGNAATLDGAGKATFQISSLAASATAYTIRACYGGATSFAASEGSVQHTVNKAVTSVALTDNPAGSSVFGQSVTFTATVSVTPPGGGTPDGSVKFYDGGTCMTLGTLLDTETLAGGQAQFSIATLAASATAHTIVACYQGSSNYLASGNSITHTVDPAQVTSTASVSPSTQQYSDKVTLSTSISIQSPGALAGQTLTGSVDFYIGTTKVGTVSGVSITSVPSTVTLTPNYALVQGQGSYTVTARLTSTNTNFSSTSAVTGETTASLTVTREDATIIYPSTNPGSVPVSQTSFTLTANVKETNPGSNSCSEPNPCPDPNSLASPGDATNNGLGNTGLSVKLTGISSNQVYNTTCTPGTVSGSGYSAYRSFNCGFTGGPFMVDAYVVDLTVTGDYYAGTYEDALTVYDPNAGFVTGGGTFTWNGDRVSFGLSFTYGKNKTTPRGGLVVVKHHADGGSCRVKSNSLGAPAVSGNTASYSGKANYTCVDELGNTTASAGNLTILGYVADYATPGAGADQFWIQAYGELVMPSPVTSGALLTGGNIQVPQPSSGK